MSLYMTSLIMLLITAGIGSVCLILAIDSDYPVDWPPQGMTPERCDLVDPEDIDLPHSSHTAEELMAIYLSAEAKLVASHPPEMTSRIRGEMAACLSMGWPIDVAACHATFTFAKGPCKCGVCRTYSHPPT